MKIKIKLIAINSVTNREQTMKYYRGRRWWDRLMKRFAWWLLNRIDWESSYTLKVEPQATSGVKDVTTPHD